MHHCSSYSHSILKNYSICSPIILQSSSVSSTIWRPASTASEVVGSHFGSIQGFFESHFGQDFSQVRDKDKDNKKCLLGIKVKINYGVFYDVITENEFMVCFV